MISISVKPTTKGKDSPEVLQKDLARTQSNLSRAIEYLNQEAGKFLLKAVQTKLAVNKETTPLRKSLKLGTWGQDAVAVFSAGYDRARDPIKRGQGELLYVRPRKREVKGKPKNPALGVLIRLSPWPPDLIAGVVDPSLIRVISRRVTKQEEDTVRTERLRQKREWDGVFQVVSNSRTIKARPAVDVRFEALRFEVGAPGVQITPAWRPAADATIKEVQAWHNSGKVWGWIMAKKPPKLANLDNAQTEVSQKDADLFAKALGYR